MMQGVNCTHVIARLRLSGDLRTLKIDDPVRIAQLASFFPGLGSINPSPLHGGFLPAIILDFYDADAEVLTVLVTEYLKWWSQGQGYHRLDPRFKEYFDTLRNEATAIESAE